MIPLTRAIDTLVIQVLSPNHRVTGALRDAKDQCKDIVEWLEWDQATGSFKALP